MKETWRTGSYRGSQYGHCLDIELDSERFSVVVKIFGFIKFIKVQEIDIPPSAIISVASRRSMMPFFQKGITVKLRIDPRYPRSKIATLFFLTRRQQEWFDAFAAFGVPIVPPHPVSS